MDMIATTFDIAMFLSTTNGDRFILSHLTLLRFGALFLDHL
jgi:hypothetical protein